MANENEVGKLRKFQEGEIILKEGEKADHLYKIISGRAEVYHKYGQEGEYLIGVFGKDRYFGDISFLTGEPSRHTVVAYDETLVLTVREEEFPEYITRNALNAVDIMKNLASSVDTLSLHISLISEEMEKLQSQGKPIPINLKEKISQYKNWMYRC